MVYCLVFPSQSVIVYVTCSEKSTSSSKEGLTVTPTNSLKIREGTTVQF